MLVYANTVGDTPLRRMIADIATWKAVNEHFECGESSRHQTQFHHDTIGRLRARSMSEHTYCHDPPRHAALAQPLSL